MFKGTVLATLVAEKALKSECQARSEHVVKPEVVQPPGLAELGSKLFREGTIVCFVTQTEIELVDRLLGATNKGDRETIDRIGSKLREMQEKGLGHRDRPRKKLRPYFDTEHLVEVRYGDVLIASGLAPSLVPVAVSEAIWNGGSLDPARFVVTDFVRDKHHPPLKALIVLVRPRLSDLEQAVLRAVPQKIDDAFVLGPSLSWTPVAEAGLNLPFGEIEGSPLFQQVVQEHGQQQVQQQQEDKQVQQQQQQQQADKTQQQQQQQQQQDRNQTVQQQAQQQQNADHQQQQQQQQQDAQTAQEQVQNNQDAQTNQEQQREGSSRLGWLDDELEGVVLGEFNQEGYLKSLGATDFKSLDATQSAKVLLRLREQFLLEGLT